MGFAVWDQYSFFSSSFTVTFFHLRQIKAGPREYKRSELIFRSRIRLPILPIYPLLFFVDVAPTTAAASSVLQTACFEKRQTDLYLPPSNNMHMREEEKEEKPIVSAFSLLLFLCPADWVRSAGGGGGGFPFFLRRFISSIATEKRGVAEKN